MGRLTALLWRLDYPVFGCSSAGGFACRQLIIPVQYTWTTDRSDKRRWWQDLELTSGLSRDDITGGIGFPGLGASLLW